MPKRWLQCLTGHWLVNEPPSGPAKVFGESVAPAAYIGERARYDASVDLESVAALLRSPDPSQVAYRQGIICRALEKRATAGVKVPDFALRQLKSDYRGFVTRWCAAEGIRAFSGAC